MAQQHQARKRFGQHFLVDDSVIDGIVRAIAPRAADRMVEIGPGLSALTQPLMRSLDHLTVIELDRDLAARLRRQHPESRLRIIESDVLQVDFSVLGEGLRIVGNLPYNISSPLMFHLLPFAGQVKDQHFMLQKEMVDRMVAKPSTAAYGRLSVMLQARYRMTALFDVPADAFDPPPRVISAIVRMVPLPESRPLPRDYGMCEKVVAKAFEQRCKRLRRSLGDWAQDLDLGALGVEPAASAEDLSVAQYISLDDALTPAEA